METNTYTVRAIVCISCNRMILANDPSPLKNIDTFWNKSTFHLVVCSMCENACAGRVSTKVNVYDDPLSAKATFVSADMIRTSNAYARACEIMDSTPDLGDFKGRVPIVNRSDLMERFPGETEISYVSVSDRNSKTMGVRPYMVTNFF
ncbi:hypothetical protein HRG_008198 [Hirsutella rhossiliensis]|uniref:Uncharacterized protein n=1 Tax=Hirsutella rhossiliensis TaxID=111463 RepID=A0A9P8MTL2_9HYPO|nr:uncharacterized protein HRG_08198 [Hirsutella rhossiliensis]KAH0961045.1 hypothetical protein HRG_08198 [Hirsutella rhossiliensis]